MTLNHLSLGLFYFNYSHYNNSIQEQFLTFILAGGAAAAVEEEVKEEAKEESDEDMGFGLFD